MKNEMKPMIMDTVAEPEDYTGEESYKIPPTDSMFPFTLAYVTR